MIKELLQLLTDLDNKYNNVLHSIRFMGDSGWEYNEYENSKKVKSIFGVGLEQARQHLSQKVAA